MEQALSFIVLLALLMITLFVLKSSIIFLITFLIGCSYLLIRGKHKNWNWNRK
jgi:hypothetical protein